MKWSAGLIPLIGSLLLPCLAAAESQSAFGAGRVAAAAHVDFKIFIPQVLSLELPSEGEAQAVKVHSNMRRAAQIRRATCALDAASAASSGVICTVSTP